MTRPKPYVVALTGGIASGKSAVARRFAALGVDVVDADVVARDVVSPGSPALADIARAFGNEFLDAQGNLDRSKMRAHVFADPAWRLRLEAILHPRIREEIRRAISRSARPYVLIVIPLFVETGAYDWVDRVLVVDVPIERQIERIVARDAVDPAMAEAMVSAQATREQRLARAHDVIVNDGVPADLDDEVAALHRRYLELASNRKKE